MTIHTAVRGRKSGSACTLAMTSHKMMPYANTSTCGEENHTKHEDMTQCVRHNHMTFF